VSRRFQVGRALPSLLPGPPPVRNGLLDEPGLGVVLRHQLRLGLDNLGKLRRQHLGTALMILLPGALQQRLIRSLLDEGMFEDVPRLWRPPPLVE
jgi:hypothetical protein